MIESSDAYRAAITGDARRVLLRAVIDIIDPDIAYSASAASDEDPYSRPDQLRDKDFSRPPKLATLERNRWLLDGTFGLYPEDPAALTGPVGYQSAAISGDDGTFADPPWVEIRFTGVSILQACSVFFPDGAWDGVPEDFTVAVYQGGTAYHTATYTGNRATSLDLTGFTVHNPDAIRVTVSKWSLPGRRFRAVEIVPGVYESWDSDIIASFSVSQQGNFACLALPYGTCTLRMDNLDRRFEPRSKTGVFQSIEERQGIDVSIGVRLPDGSDDYKRVGIFYQAGGGWRTGDNGVTMQWDLVDIVGLVADREFLVPDTLPTTLSGWIAAVVAQLGANFTSRWHVDPDYADLPATAPNRAAVTGKKCGDILRWVCMATATWPRADASTGKLTAEPFWNQGNKLDLDNMTAYPVMKANDDLAAIVFDLSGTQFVVSGNSASAGNTVSVSNPFITTQAQALTAARMILSTYGGNKLEAVGRGDPSSEIGDVDTVWLNESSATTGRRLSQTFQIQSGVLQGCRSVLLQADGSFLYQERAVLTQDGTWTAPAGVTRLRVILGQGGQGGGKGKPGSMGVTDSAHSVGTNPRDGAAGAVGSGGKIWYGTIDINPGQVFQVHIGQGGQPGPEDSPGAMGEETTFGAYSSAAGQVFPLGYTDIASGDSFGRTGVQSPLPGSSDGGAAGAGGRGGLEHFSHKEPVYNAEGEIVGWRFIYVTDYAPTDGEPGIPGGDGFAMVYWDKP